MLRLFTFIVLVATLFSGCATKRFTNIADIRNYSQNPMDYVDEKEHNVSGTFLTKETLENDFDTRYFSPWSLKQLPIDLQQAKWPWRSYTSENSFQENRQPIKEGWFKLMALEADFEKFGKIGKPGIMIRVTNVRNFPSVRPIFKDFEKAGEGYPFDYNLNSIATPNEPVFISHYSKTKEWVYVITSYTNGWVPAHNVALIAPDIIRKWPQSRQAVLLEDDLPIYDLNKEFVINSRIGMMLPIMSVENDSYQAILATSKTGGYVTFTIVRIPKSASISEPLSINSQSVAIMAKSFMGKPYGWGGLYENRDCSSTMRDMFKPFSVWLPRNSKAQGQVGRVMDVSSLTEKDKEKAIIENGVPFQTLLYKPGHIMLYLGQEDGKVMVLHDMWGVTTKAKSLEKRNVVGRTIISTLKPGKELNGYVKKSSLVAGITSMNIITMKPSANPIVLKPKKKKRTTLKRRGRTARRGDSKILNPAQDGKQTTEKAGVKTPKDGTPKLKEVKVKK